MQTTQPAPANLEIRILARSPGVAAETPYRVEVNFGGDWELGTGTFDATALTPAGPLEEEGERLFQALFADPGLRAAWDAARGASPERRIRLRIDPEASELHVHRWELLRETAAAGGGPMPPLAADAATPFSRYLAVPGEPGKPGPPFLDRPVRLVAAIVHTPGLPPGSAPIDVAAERRSLEAALAQAGKVEVSRWLEGAVTLAQIEEALQEGPHILHLVTHGMRNDLDGKGNVWLAAEPNDNLADGRGARYFDEDELAAVFRRLASPLRLVFLASCETALRSPADAFRGVAPKLVAAGVPAVLAMQERVDMETARELAGTFYRRLLEHGQIDRAANQARSVVLTRGLPGAHVPVLFLRLRDGLLLGRRGEIKGQMPDLFWDSLLSDVKKKNCTPILGPGLAEGQLPLPEEIARALAGDGYPFGDKGDLPRVTQYLASDSPDLPRTRMAELLTRHVRNRWRGPAEAETLTAALRQSDWLERSREEETEIHHQLATLDLPLYLTTAFDPLMTLALEARGRRTRRERLAWREVESLSREELEEWTARELPAEAETSLVFHLFGTDEDPASQVLTEDDHLDFLQAVSRAENNLLPSQVNYALSKTSLLFLGYRLRDLDLKILLRGFLNQRHRRAWSKLTRVAVQLDPEDVDVQRREAARYFFSSYFGEIKVYWGSTQQFVTDLCSQLEARRRG